MHLLVIIALLLTAVGLLCIELSSYVYFCYLMCIVLLCVYCCLTYFIVLLCVYCCLTYFIVLLCVYCCLTYFSSWIVG